MPAHVTREVRPNRFETAWRSISSSSLSPLPQAQWFPNGYTVHNPSFFATSNVPKEEYHIIVHCALLPQSLPNPSLPHGQLIEDLLRAEFGDAISETLMSLPSSEVKERNNEPVARNTSAVADVHMAREAIFGLGPSCSKRCCM